MIPLIGGVQELENQKAIVKRVADEVLAKAGLTKQKYLIGTMIEIPRAALLADQVAKEAEFFSFGTNDLTQTTMGLSRDDYTKFSKDYEERKIFKADPFGVLDQEGVGLLIKWAVEKGRATPSRPRNRNLRRARRRAELGAVLLPRRYGLRVVLPVSRPDRAPRCGAGSDRRRQQVYRHVVVLSRGQAIWQRVACPNRHVGQTLVCGGLQPAFLKRTPCPGRAGLKSRAG